MRGHVTDGDLRRWLDMDLEASEWVVDVGGLGVALTVTEPEGRAFSAVDLTLAGEIRDAFGRLAAALHLERVRAGACVGAVVEHDHDTVPLGRVAAAIGLEGVQDLTPAQALGTVQETWEGLMLSGQIFAHIGGTMDLPAEGMSTDTIVEEVERREALIRRLWRTLRSRALSLTGGPISGLEYQNLDQVLKGASPMEGLELFVDLMENEDAEDPAPLGAARFGFGISDPIES